MELVLFSRAGNYKLIVGFGGIWFRRSASSIPSHIYAHAHDKLEKKVIKQRNELASGAMHARESKKRTGRVGLDIG
jgi:hypothetical protein